jgi:hypothetical protein
MASVYVGDRFTCCYCGRRTIPPTILRLVSGRLPASFGWQKNWRLAVTHRFYWDLSSSLDHIKPVAHCGTDELSNLATACYRCQEKKSNRTPDELGWKLTHATGTWDGLSGAYRDLWQACGQPDPRVHKPVIGAHFGIDGRALTGTRFAAVTDPELEDQVDAIVVARVAAKDKVRLVRGAEAQGQHRCDDRGRGQRRSRAQARRDRASRWGSRAPR